MKTEPTDNAIKVDMEFDRWTVKEFAGKYVSRDVKQDRWKCQCECGNIGYVLRHNLLRRKSRQCGPCARGSRRVIPARWSAIWATVKDNTVWGDIQEFLAWVKEQPLVKARSLTIHRANEKKPYGPGNSELVIHRAKWEDAVTLIAAHRGWTREKTLKWTNTVSVSRVYAAATAITTKRFGR